MIDTIKKTWGNSKLGKIVILAMVLVPLGCCAISLPFATLSQNTPEATMPSKEEKVAVSTTLQTKTPLISLTISTQPSFTPTSAPITATSRPVTSIPTATPSPSPSPSPTSLVPSPTETPTPVLPTADRNANLRAGPGTNYPKAGQVSVGDELEIVGKTADGSWYKLAGGLWIASFLVANEGTSIPVVTDIPTPFPTSTVVPTQPTGQSDIRIMGMLRDGVKGRNEPDEYVEISNLGNAPQDMTGWRLESERRGSDSGQIFYFPKGFILQPGQICRIYTNEYHPEYCGLSFRHSRGAVWSNSKPDAALLVDNDGNMVSSWQ